MREVDAANGAAVMPRNVVVLHTEVWQTDIVEDIFGSRGLDMRTTGSGRATIFRDGRRLEGRWSRPTDDDAFRFTNGAGEAVLLAPGLTWVHILPNDWTVSSE